MQHAVVFNHNKPTNYWERRVQWDKELMKKKKKSVQDEVEGWAENTYFPTTINLLFCLLGTVSVFFYLLVSPQLFVWSAQPVGHWVSGLAGRTNSLRLVETKAAKLTQPTSLLFWIQSLFFFLLLFSSVSSLFLHLSVINCSTFVLLAGHKLQ